MLDKECMCPVSLNIEINLQLSADLWSAQQRSSVTYKTKNIERYYSGHMIHKLGDSAGLKLLLMLLASFN